MAGDAAMSVLLEMHEVSKTFGATRRWSASQ